MAEQTEQKSIFGGAWEATKPNSAGSGRYIEPGNYEVTITSCKHIDGFSGQSFVASLQIDKSDNAERPEGTTMDFVRKLSDPRTKSMSLADVRMLISKASGIDFSKVTEQNYANVVHGKQPLAGIKLKLQATRKISKTTQKPFTQCEWTLIK